MRIILLIVSDLFFVLFFVHSVSDYSLVEIETNVRTINKIKGLRKKGISEDNIAEQKQEINQASRQESIETLQLYFISKKMKQIGMN